MSMVVTTLHRYKTKTNPLTLTLGDKQIKIIVNWGRTSGKEIYLCIDADPDVDILIPSTFKKMKDRILELEAELAKVYHD